MGTRVVAVELYRRSFGGGEARWRYAARDATGEDHCGHLTGPCPDLEKAMKALARELHADLSALDWVERDREWWVARAHAN